MLDDVDGADVTIAGNNAVVMTIAFERAKLTKPSIIASLTSNPSVVKLQDLSEHPKKRAVKTPCVAGCLVHRAIPFYPTPRPSKVWLPVRTIPIQTLCLPSRTPNRASPARSRPGNSHACRRRGAACPCSRKQTCTPRCSSRLFRQVASHS